MRARMRRAQMAHRGRERGRGPKRGRCESKSMLWILLGLLLACALCSWLLPDSSPARSAARALDTSAQQGQRFGRIAATTTRRRHNTAPPATAAKPRREARRCADRCEEEARHAVPGEEDRGGAGLEVCMWLCRPERSAAPRLPAGRLPRNRPPRAPKRGRIER